MLLSLTCIAWHPMPLASLFKRDSKIFVSAQAANLSHNANGGLPAEACGYYQYVREP